MSKPSTKGFSLQSNGGNIPLCMSIELRTITTLPLAKNLFESVLELFKGKPELNEQETFRIVKVLKLLNYLKSAEQLNTETWPPPSFASDGSYIMQIQTLIPLTACKYPGIVYEALRLSTTSLYRLSHGQKLNCLKTGFLTPLHNS